MNIPLPTQCLKCRKSLFDKLQIPRLYNRECINVYSNKDFIFLRPYGNSLLRKMLPAGSLLNKFSISGRSSTNAKLDKTIWIDGENIVI